MEPSAPFSKLHHDFPSSVSLRTDNTLKQMLYLFFQYDLNCTYLFQEVIKEMRSKWLSAALSRTDRGLHKPVLSFSKMPPASPTGEQHEANTARYVGHKAAQHPAGTELLSNAASTGHWSASSDNRHGIGLDISVINTDRCKNGYTILLLYSYVFLQGILIYTYQKSE